MSVLLMLVFAIVLILSEIYTVSYAVYEAKNKKYLSCVFTAAVCVCEAVLAAVIMIIK